MQTQISEIQKIIENQINSLITNPFEDLQITDKLDQLEIIMDLEEKFNIKIDESSVNPKSLNDYVELIVNNTVNNTDARNRLAIAS